jgi:hypothetical protein
MAYLGVLTFNWGFGLGVVNHDLDLISPSLFFMDNMKLNLDHWKKKIAFFYNI